MKIKKIILLATLCQGISLVSLGNSIIEKPAKPVEIRDKCSVEKSPDKLDQLLEDAGEKQMVYSPDKNLLVHLDRRLITVWSIKERRQLQKFVLKGSSLAASFSPDGESLATADGEGNLEYLSTIKIWNLTTGEDRLIAQFLGATTHIAFSPDGSRLAAASNLNFIGSITRNPVDKKEINRIQTGGNIHVWKVSDGSELLKVDIELPEYSAKMTQLRRDEAKNDFDSNLKKAAVDALVVAYQEEVLKRAPIHLTFSSDGQRLIAVSGSGQETIIDSSNGKPIRQ